jgi:exodeoxyribonuclease VII small subunit
MAKKKETKPAATPASFEDSLCGLEEIVAELESGKLGLSEALARYEEGVKHLRMCQELLERAERRIEVLSGVDADGNPIARPFDDVETESLEEKTAVRGQRRSNSGRPAAGRGPSTVDDMDEVGRLF